MKTQHSQKKKKKKKRSMQLISQSEGHMQRKKVQLIREKPDESRELKWKGDRARAGRVTISSFI